MNIPRIVIGGLSSGSGKTTSVVALIVALRARGLKVAAFKCGPDYLDPTYHARAAGSASHNLDSWLMGRDGVLATFAHAARGADVAIIEGMMGLFDGASATSDEGSTAQIAKWLGAPVLLALDASAMARSIAAVAHGFRTFDADVKLAGLIANGIGGKGHLELLGMATAPFPIVGGFPRRAELAFPERHLGLVTASRETVPDALLHQWGEMAREWFDLDAVLAIAHSASALPVPPTEAPAIPRRCRIGIAFDRALHFYYEDNLRRLERLGAELVRFSPLTDSELPDVDGLYFGGGYPEVYAVELAENSGMRSAVRAFASNGKPIYAECGGLMYLAAAILTRDGKRHEMAGLIPVDTVMSERLQAIGYVDVETQEPTVLGPAKIRFRGQQFRYSEPRLLVENPRCSYTVTDVYSGRSQAEGYRGAFTNVLASYVHAHWASNPAVAESFVNVCAEIAQTRD